MSKEPSSASGFLVSTAALVIVVAGMRAAQPILIPFLLSIFIAVISAPPLFWLQRKRIPTAIALLIVISAVIAILLAVGVLIGTSLDDFTRSLPAYHARLREITATALGWLGQFGIQIPESQMRDQFDPGAAMDLVARLLAGLGNVLKNTLLILLTVVFILFEASGVPNKIRAAFGPQASFAHFEGFRVNLNRYLVIKTSISLLTGVTVAIWLVILGVDYPLLWGLLAFLLNYIPTIGSIIAAIPPVLLAAIQLGFGPALLVGIGYGTVNIVFGSVMEPRFMGRGVGLSTLVVFLSLVFWGWILGPVGMLLSVPLTMTMKIALDSNEDTRWLAVMLGPDIPAEAPRPTAQEKLSD
jgi:AI-2 transport protein TqsA